MNDAIDILPVIMQRQERGSCYPREFWKIKDIVATLQVQRTRFKSPAVLYAFNRRVPECCRTFSRGPLKSTFIAMQGAPVARWCAGAFYRLAARIRRAESHARLQCRPENFFRFQTANSGFRFSKMVLPELDLIISILVLYVDRLMFHLEDGLYTYGFV